MKSSASASHTDHHPSASRTRSTRGLLCSTPRSKAISTTMKATKLLQMTNVTGIPVRAASDDRGSLAPAAGIATTAGGGIRAARAGNRRMVVGMARIR